MESALAGKKILLGICGSIAAYKAAYLLRALQKAGAEVQVLMTPAATDFIAPLTLSTLSKRPVYHEVSSAAGWNNHVELGLWADAYLIAPITATTLAKLAGGNCDSMLAAVYLSARCPVFFAPAMDLDMWQHPATRDNVRRLQSFGNHLIDVEEGELASGLQGPGRLAEPEHIVARLQDFFAREQQLRGRRILITAGPTHEPLDPVRYLGNHSTGKMGVAIALECARRGAAVRLVLGPSALQPRHPGLEVVRVKSAREMYEAAAADFDRTHAAVFAAAVADYRPATVAEEKIKKGEGSLQLELVRNPDIAAELGKRRQNGQVLIGFAMETQNERENARAKLQRKGLDAIVLNSLREPGAGFAHDTNKITLLDHNKEREFELKPKSAVAADIVDDLVQRLAGS